MNFKQKLLRKIDRLYGYQEKIEYLNGQYLKAKTKSQEETLLQMIKDLQFYGQ